MKLRPEYETIRSGLLGRVPLPSLDECLNELLRKEQGQLTQVVLTQQTTNGSLEVAYATSSTSHAPARPMGDKGKFQGQDMSTFQCYSCKNYGQYASQ